MNVIKNMYHYLSEYALTSYGTPLLAFLFFIESIVLFVPVDPILIMFALKKRNQAFFYATIATISSVIGGIIAYFIGYAVWASVGQKLVSLLFSPAQFHHAVDYYRQHQNWAVLMAGFTPIPYKLVTLTAGFCKLPLASFIICSIIARGSRFFLLAGAIALWGNQINGYIDRFFNLFVLLFAALIITAFWIIH